MTEAAELIARLTAERDGWMRIVGQIAATVPLPLILKATGSTGDLIAHFKAQADHIETLEARVATLSAALEPFGHDAANWADDVPDDYRPRCTEPGKEYAHPGSETVFTVGSLRRAAREASR